jgi:hypothetical protein
MGESFWLHGADHCHFTNFQAEDAGLTFRTDSAIARQDLLEPTSKGMFKLLHKHYKPSIG